MSWGELPDNPFVGLRPFESHESLLFFGRQEQIVDLLEQLHETRFLAVVGSSGSGKSSLVRAGLIPKLEAGFLVDVRDSWRVATLKPGDAPMDNLAMALEDALPDADSAPTGARFADEIRDRGVVSILERAAAALAGDANLLILVDQFEELFRFGLHTAGGERGEETAHFVSILLELAAQRRAPIYVAMTMRSDFLGDCDAFHGLPEAMNRSQYLVPRLTRRQRRDAIEAPIRLYRGAIAPRLVDRLLNETIDARDDLPVLQHALMRTWSAWKRGSIDAGPIDVEHYGAAGTIREALSRHAEEAMAGMSPTEEGITCRLFQALTETDAGNRRIRRPARLSEIEAVTGAGRTAILAIIDRFRSDGRSFLVLSSEDDHDASVDISHESLIRQWQRLKTWVDEEAESARIYRRLADTVALHEDGKAEHLRGAALQMANRWIAGQKPTAAWARRYDPGLDGAVAFLRASQEAAERRLREKEERRKRELRRTRIVAAILGVAFLFTLAVGFYAFRKKRIADGARDQASEARDEAEEARDRAEAAEHDAILEADRNEKLRILADTARDEEERQRGRAEEQAMLAESRLRQAVEAQNEAEEQRLQAQARFLESKAEEIVSANHASLMLSALLATESLAAAETEEGKTALRRVFEWLPQSLFAYPGNPATAVALSSDGELVAATRVAIEPGSVLLEDTGDLVLYERATARELRRAPVKHAVQRLLFSPDGGTLVAAGEGRATVFATVNLSVLAEPEAWSGANDVPGMAFSADGRRLALGIAGYLSILRTDDWDARPRGVGLPNNALSVAAGPGGDARVDFVTSGMEMLVAVDLEGTARPAFDEEVETVLFSGSPSCDVLIHASPAGRLFGAFDGRLFTCKEDWGDAEQLLRTCNSTDYRRRPSRSDCHQWIRSLATDDGDRHLLAVDGDGTALLVEVAGFDTGLRTAAGRSRGVRASLLAALAIPLSDAGGRALRDLQASGDLARDGRSLVTAGTELLLWSTEPLKLAVELRRLGDEASDTAWAPNGPLAVLQGATVSVFDPSTWNELATVDLGCAAQRIESSPDGAWLAAQCERAELRIVDTGSWRVVHSLELEGLGSLRFSPDSTHLIVITETEDRLALELLAAGSWTRTTLEHDDPLQKLLWGPRPGFVAIATFRELFRADFPDFESPGRWRVTVETTSVWDLAEPGAPVARRRDTKAQGQAPVESSSEEEGRTELLHEAAMGHNLPLDEGRILDPSQSPWRVEIKDRVLRAMIDSATHLVDEACSRLPRDLNTTESVTYFRKAEPRTTCADRATAHRARGRDLARLGYPIPAEAALRRALDLDPGLGFDPAEELRVFAAQGALEEGRELARAGDFETGLAALHRAKELNPALIIDPEAEVRRITGDPQGEAGPE